MSGLARTKSERAFRWLGAALLCAALLIGPWMAGGRYIPTVCISILLFFILGALFDFMLGYLRIVNFGIAGFLAAGAYTSALAAHYFHILPWFGLLAGGTAAMLLGLVTGILTLRLRGIYVGLTTLFIMETLRFTISNAREITRGASGLTVPGFTPLFHFSFSHSQPLAYYYVLLTLVAVTYLCLYLTVHSRIGLVFRAIRDDELGTAVLGLDVVRYKLLNFVIASFFVGMFGAFYAHYIGILVPTPQEFGIQRSVEILTIAYIGGRGTLWGSFLGAIVLVGILESFRGLDEWRLILYGGALIAIITMFPGGLAGGLLRLGDRIRQFQFAQRNRAANAQLKNTSGRNGYDTQS
jgi:branched-chain amino acid transport system permease protein